MKKKILLAAMLALSLCISACSIEKVSGSKRGDDNSASQKVEHSKQVESSSQSVEPKTENEKNIKKMEYVISSDDSAEINDSFGALILYSDGNLYFNSIGDSVELIDTDVKDFSYDMHQFYLLKENGDLMESDDLRHPFEFFYHRDDIESVSNFVLTLSDGSLLFYNFDDDSWNPININAAYVDAHYSGAGIIDANGVLWYFDITNKELKKIAENVINCSFSPRNKVHYSNDLWYVTKDHTMHVYTMHIFGKEFWEYVHNGSFPKDVEAVSGSMGAYLAKKVNGHIVSGSISREEVENIDIFGQYMDVDMAHYAVMDNNGDFNFGILCPN